MWVMAGNRAGWHGETLAAADSAEEARKAERYEWLLTRIDARLSELGSSAPTP
jgi:hypothetical protein